MLKIDVYVSFGDLKLNQCEKEPNGKLGQKLYKDPLGETAMSSRKMVSAKEYKVGISQNPC
jgi:hypothetical protein